MDPELGIYLICCCDSYGYFTMGLYKSVYLMFLANQLWACEYGCVSLLLLFFIVFLLFHLHVIFLQ